ncbi:hypothetical protein [Methanoregula sp.]|uniref:hypothetical protein n=1 Tax=Methanoregula sp. TaxID=2052170 RepID=UPI003C740E20
MTEHEKETTIAGSARVLLPEGAGGAGTSCEESQSDENKSGAVSAGQENEELEWACRHVKDEPAPEPANEVFRKTELHTTPPDTGSDELKKLMRQMMQRLKSPDPEILYLQYENSYRDFICSVLARQYREEKQQREQVAALWEQIDLLDERLERSIDRLERLIHEATPRGVRA